MGKNITLVGATGAVGQELIGLLDKVDLKIDNLKLLASARSAGKKIKVLGEEILVEELKADSFKGTDIAFFAAGGSISTEFVPHAVNAGAIVIDKTSVYRMNPDVPLVVPEVNPEAIKQHKGIIATPNCTTTLMVLALNPLHQVSRIKKVIVSTYQAVSGTGAQAIQELEDQVQAYVKKQPITPHVYPTQIAFNLIPHVDSFQENGYTKEEMKMVDETKKIMSDMDIKVSATCVRVPVFRAHSEAIQIETENKISAAQAHEILSNAPGVKVIDTRTPGGYATPLQAVGSFDTYVSRIREDLVFQNGLSFWVVGDQLLKGAALNALQIAKLL